MPVKTSNIENLLQSYKQINFNKFVSIIRVRVHLLRCTAPIFYVKRHFQKIAADFFINS
jgi:hypothetical protein